MSEINRDALREAQWDEWIDGCRRLRALREPYLEKTSDSEPSLSDRKPLLASLQDESSDQAPTPSASRSCC